MSTPNSNLARGGKQPRKSRKCGEEKAIVERTWKIPEGLIKAAKPGKRFSFALNRDRIIEVGIDAKKVDFEYMLTMPVGAQVSINLRCMRRGVQRIEYRLVNIEPT